MTDPERDELFRVPPPCRLRTRVTGSNAAWRRIVALLEAEPARAWRLIEIATVLGLTYDHASVRLAMLCRDGRAERVAYGLYSAAKSPHLREPAAIR